MIGTWRDVALNVKHHLDVAEGVGPSLPDFKMGSEAGSGVDEERFRIEKDAAAFSFRIGLVRREVVMAVKRAPLDEVFAPLVKILHLLRIDRS